jgi:hypothetical protein
MPSASPLPRGPSVLVLGQPGELITRPGCPACRHVAEASDRYLTWFALEAHGDAGVVTRLSASLGMCSLHTRALLIQPGASVRLTAVYRYLLQALPDQLASRRWQPDECPACQQAAGTTERVLSMVREGLAEPGFRDGYQEAGGLCVPHLRGALDRCRQNAASWLAGIALARLRTHPWCFDLLAGGPDPGADERARLRAALGVAGPGSRACPCPVCRSVLRAEMAYLELAARQPAAEMCARHLRVVVRTTGQQPEELLAAYVARQASYLVLVQARRRRSRHTARIAAAGCAVCRECAAAGQRELHRCSAAGSWLQLCVRHVLELRVLDAAVGRQAAEAAARRAAVLQGELAEASRKQAWAHRQEARGAEMSAWQRAAAFLDGTTGAPAG